MEKWLKEVGRGKRGARDLALEEARDAVRLIVHGKATPAQIGAFLVAERIKTESAEEILAFAEVLREAADRLVAGDGEADRPAAGGLADRMADASPASRLDCAGPYNGRQRTFAATWPAAFVLAEAGLAVTLHGVREIGPKRGITLHAMLLTRGIDPAAVPMDRLAKGLRELGVGYAPAERLCPPLRNLHDIREQLGLRTVLNTAEKLLDYGRSPYLAFGIFHRNVAERYGEVIARLGYERAAIVQGMEGSEDLYIDRPTMTWRVERDGVAGQVIDPDRLGMKRAVPETGWTAERQAEIAEQVLSGAAPEAFREMTVLNAAFRLQLAGKAETLEDGIGLARSLLASGKPRARYEAWKAMLAGASGGV